jgi:hypothetical protein
MMRSSKFVSLLFLGSALTLVGCEDQPCQLGPDGKPLPLPDGSPNPNCSRSSRSYVRSSHGLFLVTAGGHSNYGARSAGVSSGGFGRTGGGFVGGAAS